MKPASLMSALVILSTGAAAAGISPGEPPPRLEDQLTARLAVRHEPYTLPDETLVVGDLYTWLNSTTVGLQAVFPRAVSNLDDVFYNDLANVRLQPSADFLTNCGIIHGAMFGAWQRVVTTPTSSPIPPSITGATPEAVAAAIGLVFRDQVRKIVRARVTGITLSDAFIDGAISLETCTFSIGAGFQAENPAPPTFQPYLAKDVAADLAGFLKKLPRVLRMKEVAGGKLPDSSGWSKAQGAWFAPQDVRLHNGKEITQTTLLETSTVPKAARDNIAWAFGFVLVAVDKNLLDGPLRPPAVFVHVHNQGDLLIKLRDAITGYTELRAYSEGHALGIHIDQADPARIIVHELGHQLENQLGTPLWLAIHRVLRGRHALAKVRTLMQIYPEWQIKLPIAFGFAASSLREEAGYRADMPGTGAYSTRAYDGPGATEVFSMTMQRFFENADAMIDRDPLVAAVILYALDPTGFIAGVPSKFHGLLPIAVKP